MRQTFCHKWSKNEDTERNLHFIDLNGCYAEASRLFLYPTGKASILIDKYLDDISFDGEALKSSKKQIYGLIKAQILPSHTCEPMFPLKFKDKIFYVYCKKCLESDSKKPCQHTSIERSFSVTTSVQALNFALKNKFIELIKIFEIWDHEKEEPVFQKFVNILLDLKENVLKDKSSQKFIKHGLQMSFGKLSTNPNEKKQFWCKNFKELNEVFLKYSKISNITPIDDQICNITVIDNAPPRKTNYSSLILGSQITWQARVFLEMKLQEIRNNFQNVELLMLQTDAAVLTIPSNLKLEDKIVFSSSNGAWKHQFPLCREITNFYSLNAATYCIIYKDYDNQIRQINKIAGFCLQSISPKLNKNEFENLLLSAIEGISTSTEMQQIVTSKKENCKKKMVFSLKSTIVDSRRIPLENFKSLAYGHKCN